MGARMPRRWLLFLTLVALGCSAPRKDPPPPTAMPLGPVPPSAAPVQLRIEALEDGQDVPLVAGAQGGFHVWLQYSVRDLPPGTVRLERTAHRVADGAVVLRYLGDSDVGEPDADGWFTAPAPIPMFMCPTPIGVSVVDQPIAFALRVLDDAGGERARTDITLTPRCPDDQRDFCTRICTG
jgi:hypothetical protein